MSWNSELEDFNAYQPVIYVERHDMKGYSRIERRDLGRWDVFLQGEHNVTFMRREDARTFIKTWKEESVWGAIAQALLSLLFIY